MRNSKCFIFNKLTPCCAGAIAVNAEIVDRHSPEESCHAVGQDELDGQAIDEDDVHRVQQVAQQQAHKRKEDQWFATKLVRES